MTPEDVDALVRLAHGALAPARVDRLVRRHGSVAGAVRAIETAGDPPEAIRAAVRVSAVERADQLAEAGIRFLVPGPAASRDDAAMLDEVAMWKRIERFPGGPRWLFARGHWPDVPTVAIVGTRTCTAYGERLAEEYGAAAADAGWQVVSGMARGIDGAAHRGALGRRGYTTAVLGSGVDVVYPRRHRALYAAILESGCILSEYPPGTRPDGWRFPTRNRIISALADVVLVVEAGETGGALITARLAIDQGVPVFATPGDVDRVVSMGTNRLIRDGAFPVFDADDLSQVLDLIVPFAAVGDPAIDR
jgi:DNA processing protein